MGAGAGAANPLNQTDKGQSGQQCLTGGVASGLLAIPPQRAVRDVVWYCEFSLDNGCCDRASTMHKNKKSGLSGKEAADDVPSWAQGERPLTTENGRDFARRLLDDKYGAGNYPTGPGSEFNKIKKWGDRAFE